MEAAGSLGDAFRRGADFLEVPTNLCCDTPFLTVGEVLSFLMGG